MKQPELDFDYDSCSVVDDNVSVICNHKKENEKETFDIFSSTTNIFWMVL